MKIVADEDIPNLQNYFGFANELILKPGREINSEDLLTADMLIVRSVTKVNQDLLQDSSVRFVGSVTTGTDHLDTAWMDEAGIQWAVAKGCNATAVVEYVVTIIAALQKMEILPNEKLRTGVIGVGEIGSQVVEILKMLGFSVIQYDPIRAMNEKDFISTPLEKFLDLDIVTLHAPFTREGSHPTYHMIEKYFLLQQKKNCVLVNASRGELIDSSDLLEYGQLLYWCLDVWEHEPYISLEMLETALITTPHIAGYSVQSKLRGIEMIYRLACEKNIIPAQNISSVEFPTKVYSFNNKQCTWQDVVLALFDPRNISQHMKDVLLGDSQETFDMLRKNFDERYEFGCVKLHDIVLNNEEMDCIKKLNFKI